MSRTPPADIACPRCGAPIGTEQAWCLTCGAPARTRMRPTPNWKLPLVAIAAIVLIVAGGTVGAFVALTTDNEAPKASTVPSTSVPEAVPPAAVPETPTVDPNAADPNAVDPNAPVAPPATTATTPAPPANTGTASTPTPPAPTTTAPAN